MTSNNPAKFVILAILDGWGIAAKSPGNAIALAKTTNMNIFKASYPHTQLQASGQAVGLPRGEAGNTETGHLNLGAGRIVYQDLKRINTAIAEGTFFEKQSLINAINHTIKYKSKLHYMGLVGAGGVHSNIEHLFALIQLAKKLKIKNLFIHVFTDGRDSPPTSAQIYINKIKEVIKREGIGKIASMMGRYWAMDRDQRWERTKRAYLALTKGLGNLVNSPEEAIKMSYKQGKTDEFIEPYLISENLKKPITLIEKDDAVVFFNFRVDRPRQLTKAFVYKDFSQVQENYGNEINERINKDDNKTKDRKSQETFDRGKRIDNLFFVTMTEYDKSLSEEGVKVAFPPEQIKNSLGAILSRNNINQLRITESEKERFVTFYFNGLKESPFPLEKQIIIPSPKVTTYDQKPQMSSKELTDNLLKELKRLRYKFILVNYPNPDMVGHTGNVGPCIKAVETVDECLGKIADIVLAYDGVMLITADHGNAEEMINLHTGQIDTEHSCNPVPLIAVSKRLRGRPRTLTSGILADLAPTVLYLLGLEIPPEMTGRNLLEHVWNQ